MSWRSDIGNAPKDRPILVYDGRWTYLAIFDDDYMGWSEYHESVPIFPTMWLDPGELPERKKNDNIKG